MARLTFTGLMSTHTVLAVVFWPGSPRRCRHGGGGMEGVSSSDRPLRCQDRPPSLVISIVPLAEQSRTSSEKGSRLGGERGQTSTTPLMVE